MFNRLSCNSLATTCSLESFGFRVWDGSRFRVEAAGAATHYGSVSCRTLAEKSVTVHVM